MSRNNTGNPIGSKAFLDFEDNVKSLDEAVNSEEDTFQDRLGKSRLTWDGIVKAGTGDAGVIVPIVQDAVQDAVQDVVAGVDGQVAVAQSAADRAEAASDAAQLSAGVYPNTASGIAATTGGQYFSVPSDEDDEYLILYRHGASSSATEVKRYPSAQAARLGVLANELAEVQWLDASAYALAGTTTGDWDFATYPHRKILASAIKDVFLEGFDPAKTYVISQFNLGHSDEIDRIIIADVGGDWFVDTGKIEIPKSAGITKVVLQGSGSRRATMWIDYNKLSAVGVTRFTAGLPAPLIIANGARQIANSRLFPLEETIDPAEYELKSELGYIPWLNAATLSRTGSTIDDWNYTAQPYRKMVARAIKYISIKNPNPAKQYVVSQFNLNHPTNGDRIIIADTGGGTLYDSGFSVIDKKVGELTKIGSGDVQIWIDYTELLSAGTPGVVLVSSTTNPLQFSQTSPFVVDDQRISALEADSSGRSYGRIACLGDSITMIGEYPAKLGALLEGEGLKMGFGGCRMAEHNPTGEGVYKDHMCMYRLAAAISSGDYSGLLQAADDLLAFNGQDFRAQSSLVASTDWSDIDIAVIFFGTNDFGASIPLGDAAEVLSDGSTFIGAMNYAIESLQEAYPYLQIVMVTPMWRARRSSGDGKDSDEVPNSAGIYLIEYVDAIIEAGERYHIPVIDMYRNSGINKLNWQELIPDGLHPAGGIGYTRVANKISAGIKAKL